MDRLPAVVSAQPDLFETDAARSLLDQLINDSRLYTQSKDYKALLDFVVRLRNFAPFNAMLLQIQKPGLTYAASARDWLERFDRQPKVGARPLLILWPFGPVALVYDVMDTEGQPLPEDAASFVAIGGIDAARMDTFIACAGKKNIECVWIDAGDGKAGSITVTHRGKGEKDPSRYRISINRNHPPPVQFATLAHELGHLFLGHLGRDGNLSVPARRGGGHALVELEAESVAYLVCERNGVTSKSAVYLSNFVEKNTSTGALDLYQVMRAAGHVEALLELTAHTRYDRPPIRRRLGARNP
ncbi:ImmA/IrrE family metallo-endopeptidase [Humitalea sp. 24SJ18S-53]|uniref:ImmA/IrrE family metallo-endopeptidase n=1 Tax=Humitalea sp. 24SJ18S-53 TaxID=3422307 RepID=UPI003D670722